jgi:hypothetical protein
VDLSYPVVGYQFGRGNLDLFGPRTRIFRFISTFNFLRVSPPISEGPLIALEEDRTAAGFFSSGCSLRLDDSEAMDELAEDLCRLVAGKATEGEFPSLRERER